MGKPTVVICIDGFDPDYLDACETPNLDALAARGFMKIGKSLMPSVTNVNNVSLVTASYPEVHGISSNYRLVRETGHEVYMESGSYILAETMFERALRTGMSSILVTSKDKLRTLLSTGATVAVSSERPPDWLVSKIGEPPKVYSLEVNGWAIRAGIYALKRHPADLLYITTTDYAMHTFAPDEPESQAHMTILDDAIGDLVETHPEATLLVTADHGMSAKGRMVDLGSALARRGIKANPVPIIKDRYVLHHANLGGSIFVYLDDGDQIEGALKALREIDGVEEALSSQEAASRFRLHPDRIGDIVVTGEPDVVFGDPSEVELPPKLRSHASMHECDVPILGYNGDFAGFEFQENRDVGRYVFERVLK